MKQTIKLYDIYHADLFSRAKASTSRPCSFILKRRSAILAAMKTSVS